MISLNVNGKEYKADVAEDASLLWVLRDHLKLTGTPSSAAGSENVARARSMWTERRRDPAA